MKKLPLLLLTALLAGCASSRLEQLQKKSDQCETSAQELRRQTLESNDKIATMQSQAKDLAGQAADLADKLKAAQERIDSLDKSNKDLSAAIDANKGEQGQLSGKVSEIVKEKDALAKEVDALRKDKIASDRAKANLRLSREKLAADLSLAKAKLDEAASTSQAAKDKAEADRQARLAKAHEDLGALADAVLKEVQAEKANLAQNGESVALTLQESLLFAPQQAKLTEDGVALLDRVGRAIQALGPRDVRVEGHSDNSKIKWELFGSFTSHWELTAARATAVARYLHEHAGLDPRRLTPAGFGEFRPIQGNDTAAGREANRRMVLVVSPVQAAS